MNQQQRKNMYPAISYNSKARCEKRWEEDITPQSIFQDLSCNWKISLGNGKRIGRKWRKCDGIADVLNHYGGTQTIYNHTYDVELKRAYDRQYQPDDDPDFYLGDPFTNYR